MGRINKNANLYNHKGELMVTAGCYPNDRFGSLMPFEIGLMYHKPHKRK